MLEKKITDDELDLIQEIFLSLADYGLVGRVVDEEKLKMFESIYKKLYLGEQIESLSGEFDILNKVLGPGNFSQIAQNTGLARSHVSRVLRGMANPSLETLQVISNSCKLPTSTISTYIRVAKELNDEK